MSTNSQPSPSKQMLSANRREPIQHLPFFSSTDLQIDPVSGQGDDVDTPKDSQSKFTKLRQVRKQTKLVAAANSN